MNVSTRYLVADVFDGLRSLPDASVDLVMTSPPFLNLRAYLPSEDERKHLEIGSEATPADFIDSLLDVVEECRRVLTPFGTLVFELGDTYSGSGGAGGDYNEGGLREGQEKFDGSGRSRRRPGGVTYADNPRYRAGTERSDRPGQLRTTTDPAPRPRVTGHRLTASSDLAGVPNAGGGHHAGGVGWPLDKSLTGIPTLFAWSLAYGRNLLRPERSIEPWRIRNLIVWARPNPPVGALSDKMRPATSYLTVACTSRQRWFDMDAVRHAPLGGLDPAMPKGNGHFHGHPHGEQSGYPDRVANAAGAPLLDYWFLEDELEQDVWEISTQPYKGSHYATFPEELPRRVILSMCPERVCLTCGEPSRRITEDTPKHRAFLDAKLGRTLEPLKGRKAHIDGTRENGAKLTVGWTDCGHNAWRPGVVLDPFAGSGTTLRMAQGNGRSSIGIDFDPRNADLAVSRVGGLFLDVEYL